MSLLAHAVYAAQDYSTHIRKLAVERKNLDRLIKYETTEAKRLQKELNISWGEALRLARGKK